MGAQLSLKAAIPLAGILATCRKNVSNTGPWQCCLLYLSGGRKKEENGDWIPLWTTQPDGSDVCRELIKFISRMGYPVAAAATKLHWNAQSSVHVLVSVTQGRGMYYWMDWMQYSSCPLCLPRFFPTTMSSFCMNVIKLIHIFITCRQLLWVQDMYTRCSIWLIR